MEIHTSFHTSSNYAGAILGGLALTPPAQQTLLPMLPPMSREPLMDDIMNRPRHTHPLRPSKVQASAHKDMNAFLSEVSSIIEGAPNKPVK